MSETLVKKFGEQAVLVDKYLDENIGVVTMEVTRIKAEEASLTRKVCANTQTHRRTEHYTNMNIRPKCNSRLLFNCSPRANYIQCYSELCELFRELFNDKIHSLRLRLNL